MSIRPVKRILKSRPTMEGAGVKLRRAFGFGDPGEHDPFLLLDDFRNDRPATTRPAFPGTPIAASRRSPTSWRGPSTMPTAWATGVRLAPAMSNG